MFFSIYLTGAFHEDGFADFCDGFGGGNSKEKILEIMKDSRIGTYGSIGIISVLSAKFFTLLNIDVEYIPVLLISGHSFSRIFPVLIIYSLPYAREDLSSKVKPVGHKGSVTGFIFAFLTGITPLIFIPLLSLAVIIPCAFLTFIIFRWYIKRKLEGYTGDVLGALQQLMEVIFYLSFLVYEYKIMNYFQW